MSSQDQPTVLIVDDHPEEQRAPAAALRLGGLDVAVSQPHELADRDLLKADVIAIDQYYDWNILPHPEQIAYWPNDGLALAAVVTRRLYTLKSHSAVVLRTGQLDALADSLPRAARVPLLAAQHGIDWVLEKNDEHSTTKLHQLAAAVSSLKPLSDDDGSWDEGAGWLNVPAESFWRDSALAEVQVCRPPEHQFARYTSGTAWLRWFAHRVLPFPTFLVSDLRAATILGMSLEQLEQILSEEASELGRELLSFTYSGNLSSLVGRRWWRAALEEFVDRLLMNAAGDLDVPETVAHAYLEEYGTSIEVFPFEQPVVTIDADYDEIGVAEAEECLRLAPDFWPVFADQPWAELGDVDDDPELTVMVSRGDRGRLSAAGV